MPAFSICREKDVCTGGKELLDPVVLILTMLAEMAPGEVVPGETALSDEVIARIASE